MIWRHDKIVRKRRSRATSRHSFMVVQHFVSDTLYQTCYFFASDTAFPTDETWYKQLYIHIVYIIRLSNVFMIKHKKNHVSFIEFIIIIIEFIIIIYYILSSNKGIFVWPIWPEVNRILFTLCQLLSLDTEQFQFSIVISFNFKMKYIWKK